jgi:hypothetical protein
MCDHEGMPRGTASRWKTRYAVRLSVPRRGGWRAWGAVRADFERALAEATDPAIASAEIASELRRGADWVRVTVAVTVVTADVADALAIAWDAFRSATKDDLTGWEVAAAAAQVQPELPLTEVSVCALMTLAFLHSPAPLQVAAELIEGCLRLPARGGAGRSTAGTSHPPRAGTAAQDPRQDRG